MLSKLKTLWDRRELIISWAWYEIQSQYIQTKIGMLWLIVQPLLMAGVYTLAFDSILRVRAPRDGVPFVCFYIVGMTPFKLVSTSLMKSGNTVVKQIKLMQQISFPREIAIFVEFIKQIVEFVGAFLAMHIVLLAYGYYPNVYYFYLPLILIALSAIVLGIMLFLGSVGVFVKDTPSIVSPLVRLLFFISGVLFSIEDVEAPLGPILNLNPILKIVESFRNVVVYKTAPSNEDLVYLFLFGTASLIIGYVFFKRRDATFVDHI